MSRRFVIGIVAAVLAVMVLGGILVWAVGGGGSPRTAALEESRSNSSGSWYLYGGTGAQTFWADLESVAGCDAQGEVAVGQDPATGDPGKQVSGLVPSACRLQVTVNQRANSALYAWLNDALTETHTRRDLTLLKRPSTTSSSNQDLGISLEDALIERVELPAFANASSAPEATIALTVRPEQTTRDSSPAVPNPPSSGKPAPARTSSFDVDVGGIGSLRPSRFEPWSAAVEITRGATGVDQIQANQATETSLGDLGLSISLENTGASNANQLHNWFEDLVIQNQGTPDPSEERTLTFTVRDPASATNPPFLTVTFTNVGIFAQPSYALGNDPEKFLFYAEGASFAGAPPAAP